VFQRLLKKLASSLNKRQIPYMVIVGQAVLLYGEPRLTKDIDITLGIGVDRLGEITAIADQIGLKYLTDEDVVSILLKNPEYDSHCIEKWLAEFDAALDKNYRETLEGLQKGLK
jgi:hypothetical protein